MPTNDQSIPPSGPGTGALLNDAQVKRLKVAITVMTALLAIGIVTLIGRVIYLAQNKSDASRSLSIAQPLTLTPEARLALPRLTQVKTISVSGTWLIVHHVGPTGDGVSILDLATGKTLSQVKIDQTQ
jgi:Family of unknown function (DUF6476)